MHTASRFSSKVIHEESLNRFRKALQLDPKYADAAHNLALALFTGTGLLKHWTFWRNILPLSRIILR